MDINIRVLWITQRKRNYLLCPLFQSFQNRNMGHTSIQVSDGDISDICSCDPFIISLSTLSFVLVFFMLRNTAGMLDYQYTSM